MEAHWGLQDGHWGRQVAAGGPPKVKECGHLMVGMRVYPPPLSGKGMWALAGWDEGLPPPRVGTKSKGMWSLDGWDTDFGGPYLSFGQPIVSHSLVAP